MKYINNTLFALSIIITLVVYYHYWYYLFKIPNAFTIVAGVKFTIFQFFVTLVNMLLYYFWFKKNKWIFTLPFVISMIPLVVFWIFKADNIRRMLLGH